MPSDRRDEIQLRDANGAETEAHSSEATPTPSPIYSPKLVGMSMKNESNTCCNCAGDTIFS